MTTPRLVRQESLSLTIPHSVSIVGCGGVGSWTAIFLALAGVPKLWLWDGDEVSDTNLNRLPLGPDYLELNKAIALKLLIAKLVPSCAITAAGLNWTIDLQRGCTAFPEWIVAATDSWASRKLVHKWATFCITCNRNDHDNIDD